MMRLSFIAVEPTGQITGAVLVHGGLRDASFPTYPITPETERLVSLRLVAHRGLRATAHALGMTATELSQLERGEVTLVPAEWRELLGAVAALAAEIR